MIKLKKIAIFLCIGWNFYGQAEDKTSEKLLKFVSYNQPTNSRIAMEVLGKAYQNLGYDTAFIEMPIEKAAREANKENSEYDGLTLAPHMFKDKLTNLLDIRSVLASSKISAFGRDKNVKVEGWDSLRHQSVVIVKGFSPIEIGTKNFSNLEKVATANEALQMVSSARKDFVIIDLISTMFELKSIGYTNVFPLERPLVNLPLVHYVHKKHAALAPLIDAELEKLKKSGETTSIITKYYAEIGL